MGLVEALGPPAVLVGMGDGSNRAVHAAAARPDLIDAVVCAAGNPVGATAVEGTDGLAGSESVLEALMSMMETDYRGALRTMIGTANPSFDEETLRMRVALDERELPAGRRRGAHALVDQRHARWSRRRRWATGCGCSSPAATRGSRSRSRAARELLIPEAHIREVEDGALSRPDITVDRACEP